LRKQLVYLLSTLSPKQLASKALAKGSRSVRHVIEETRLRCSASEPSDRHMAANLALSRDLPGDKPDSEGLRAAALKPRIPHHEPTDAFLQQLGAAIGGIEPRDLEEADHACEHRLRLPGGRFADFGAPINWNRDPVSGHCWDNVYWKRLSETKDGADILSVWWAVSFYHLIPLGKAYRWARLNRNAAATDKYSKAFVEQNMSWIETSHYGFGPSWKSCTIVALRLIHLIWARALFYDAVAIPDEFWIRLYKQIHVHAKHVRSNLEWFPVRTNHYLTNLHALFMVGVLYPEFKQAKDWAGFAHGELIAEIEHHCASDGVAHEGSINYHRFVCEIFLAAMIFGEQHGFVFPDSYKARLEAALEFLMRCLRPDGALPRIGDAADIRLQHLDQRDYFANPGHLLNLGAVLYRRGDFKAAAPDYSEYAFWMLGAEGAKVFASLDARDARRGLHVFADGGYAIYHDDRVYLIVRCGRLALDGVAGHGHYDQLSFELWFAGRPVFVDPGWYVYEADPKAQKYLKSTQVHNTVSVDGRNQINVDLFIYPPPSRPVPKIIEARITDEGFLICGEHGLYSDLPDPVTHRRIFSYERGRATFRVRDTLSGRKTHQLQWSFHSAKALRVTKSSAGTISFADDRISGAVSCVKGACGSRIEPGWQAAKYGERDNSSIAMFEIKAELPQEFEFEIQLTERGRDCR